MKIPQLTLRELNHIKSNYQEFIKEPITFLFVTRDRCPYKDPLKNPLYWAILTLENNRIKKPDNYLIVSDNSIDYTEDCIEYCKSKFKKDFILIKLPVRKGCSYARRVGIENLTTELFFMGDDDCLYTPDFLSTNIIIFKLLQKKFSNLGVLNCLTFERDVDYRGVEILKHIGKTYFDENTFFHNFDKFPIEYKNHKKYIDKYANLLEPFEVDTFSGVSLNSRTAILNSGNFEDLSNWANDYLEHLIMGQKLLKKGYVIYHNPNKTSTSVHLKFGADSRDYTPTGLNKIKFPKMKLDLEQIIKLSQNTDLKGGCRLSDTDFHINEIGSLVFFYLNISEDLGIKQALKEYNYFVKSNYYFSTTTGNIEGEDTRFKIWREGINKACTEYYGQSKESYNIFCEKIFRSLDVPNVNLCLKR